MRDIERSSTPEPGAAARIGRRRLLQGSLLTLGSAALGAAAPLPVWAQGRAPAVVTPDRLRPGIPCGVQSGDVSADRAIVWSKTDRPARLIVEYSTSDTFRSARRIVGPAALAETDWPGPSPSRGRATKRDRGGASTRDGAA